MTIRTTSPDETIAVGARIAAALEPPALVMLVGDLGAGKTTMAKGIVAGLGAASADDVLSPTFSLVHEFPGNPKVYHLDLYRLDTVPELDTLGLEDIWNERAVVIVEWGEKFDGELPGLRMEVCIEYDGDDARIVRLEGPAVPGPQPL